VKVVSIGYKMSCIDAARLLVADQIVVAVHFTFVDQIASTEADD